MLQKGHFVRVHSKEENEIVRAYYVEHYGVDDDPWCDQDYLDFPLLTIEGFNNKQRTNGYRAGAEVVKNGIVTEFLDWAAAHGVLCPNEFECGSTDELANLLGVV